MLSLVEDNTIAWGRFMRSKIRRGPVSRVLLRGVCRAGDHSSRTTIAWRLEQPTRGYFDRVGPTLSLCLVLHRVGFT